MLWTGAPSSLNSWRSWVKASRWLPSARAATPRARRARAAISPLSAGSALASARSACLRAAPESAAQGEDGGRDHVGGRGDEFHLVRLGQAGGFGGGFLRLVPASGVDVQPAERGQARAAGAPRAGGPEPLHGVLQQGDRQVGFVQEPCGGTDSPQGGLVKGRAADLAQGRDELASAAERVGAGPYPEPVRADLVPAGHGRQTGTPGFPGARERGLRPGGWRARPSGRRRWPRPRGRPRRGPAGHAMPLRRRR